MLKLLSGFVSKEGIAISLENENLRANKQKKI
jgi:hypothetical protein